jgi:hypothetical protein
MARLSLKFASVLLLASLCLPGLSLTATAQRGGIRKPKAATTQPAKKQQPDPPAAYTPAPLDPLPLDQMPTVAPLVTYQEGLLTIVAHNCTLADVLRAIHKQTGADLDIPPGATERVVADLGPGSAREVIADLLNGTHFNYVMVGSTADPTAVQSIALTPKTGGPETAAATPPNRPGFPAQRVFQPRTAMSPVQQGAVPPEAGGAQQDEDAADGADETADTTEAQDEQQQQSADPNQQTPKTPEQLLQELQRQQQQQQQQQQQPQSGQQPGQPPQVLFPNQPPTAQPAPTKPD